MDKMSTKGSRVYKCFLKQRVNSKDEAEITGSDEFHENPIELRCNSRSNIVDCSCGGGEGFGNFVFEN